MESYDWKEEYAIGIDNIDKQHKQWLNILNQLHIAYKENRHLSVMDSILQQLYDYTRYHFETEEKLLEKLNYKAKQEHKQLHASFIKKLNKLSADHTNRKATLTYELLNFLRNWLLDHIQWEDKNYALVLKQNGVSFNS